VVWQLVEKTMRQVKWVGLWAVSGAWLSKRECPKLYVLALAPGCLENDY
jgi:hypothetical protein